MLVAAEIKAAEVENTIEAKRVAAECKEFDKEIKRYDDWEDASNEEIEKAMRNIKEWKKRLSKIEDRLYSMQKNVQLFDLTSIELDKSTNIVENLKTAMGIMIREIEEQDEARGLYSLSESNALNVKLPRFGGEPNENFPKFKAEMLRGFKSNKVRREDQIKRLRENLFDQPKAMVPFGMESIKDAWEILDNMYGDPAMVMNAKLLELKSLKENSDSGYPRKGGGLNLLRAQIEWIVRLEVTVNGIIDLGQKSKQLDREAFNSNTLVSVMELFPFEMQDNLAEEMIHAEDDVKEKLYLIRKYLKKLRLRRQEMQKIQELGSGLSENTDQEKYKQQRKRKSEILDIRQKIYLKLNEGKNVSSIMKIFKSKVEKFMKDYRVDLSYDEEKCWRDKVIITEKAVAKYKEEQRAEKECHSSRGENVARSTEESMVVVCESCAGKDKSTVPVVKEFFDTVKAQETAIESLPEPPHVDNVNEIEERLKKLKKFNKKQLINRKRKVEVKIAKDVGRNGNDVDSIVKDEDIFDLNKITESCDENELNVEVSSNGAEKKYEENVIEVIVHKTNDNASDKTKHEDVSCANDADEKYQAEVREFNDWYYKILEERKHSKDKTKTSRKLCGKIANHTNSIIAKDMNDDMYKQVPEGTGYDDVVDKKTDVSTIVPFLQVIFAMLFICGKTIHEQSLSIVRLSKMSHPSRYNHLQPENTVSVSNIPQCLCQNTVKESNEFTTDILGKVRKLASMASTDLAWLKQICGALCGARENAMYAVNLGVSVLYQGLVPEA